MNGARVALLESIEDSDEEYLELNLQAPLMRADTNAKANALCFATRKNKTRSVKILVKEGADPFIKYRGRTPLYWAVLQDSDNLLKLLLSEALLDLQVETETLKLESSNACGGARTEAQKFVSRAKRALNEACFDAAAHLCLRSLKYLLEVGADPNCYFYHDDEFLSFCTPLIAACYAPIGLYTLGEVEHEQVEAVIECLISHGADIFTANHLGDTPLHWAAASGLLSTIQLLLRNGADINKKNSLLKTPLIMAAEYCKKHDDFDWNIPIVERLIDWEADVNSVDFDMWNALFYAVQGGNLDLTTLLLEQGAQTDIKIDTQDPENNNSRPRTSALFLAVSLGHYYMVKELLQWNADVNAVYQSGGYTCTCLTAAAVDCSKDTVDMLLSAGATHASIKATCDHLSGAESPRDASQDASLYSTICKDRENILLSLRQAATNPFTMKHLCRLVIRQTASQCGAKIADFYMLPLPESLIEYVQLEDL